MTKKILIDAGKSRRGWSRIGTYFKCPQLFAYQNRLNLQLIPADALTRGSMGHVMQAHQHAIWGCEQGGVLAGDSYVEDASTLYTPEESVHEWVRVNGEGEEHIPRMIETFRRYIATYPEPPGRIVSVEYPITAVLGNKGNQWGLWVVHPEDVNYDPRAKSIRACDGSTIQPTPLNCPGHPDHGAAIELTRRIDMATQDRAGRVYIWDHKHQARVQPGKSVDGYAIDGGFSAFRIMGRQLWPDTFGGVALNLIQTTDPWKVARPMVPATPHRDGHFAEMLWYAEHALARLDVDQPNHWAWPKAQHETTCVGRYGACAGIKMCFYGEAGVEAKHRKP
jgi:hypothetical protein